MHHTSSIQNCQTISKLPSTKTKYTNLVISEIHTLSNLIIGFFWYIDTVCRRSSNCLQPAARHFLFRLLPHLARSVAKTHAAGPAFAVTSRFPVDSQRIDNNIEAPKFSFIFMKYGDLCVCAQRKVMFVLRSGLILWVSSRWRVRGHGTEAAVFLVSILDDACTIL